MSEIEGLIEDLKLHLRWWKEDFIGSNKFDIVMKIINIIEKQQTEIEHLKKELEDGK